MKVHKTKSLWQIFVAFTVTNITYLLIQEILFVNNNNNNNNRETSLISEVFISYER